MFRQTDDLIHLPSRKTRAASTVSVIDLETKKNLENLRL